MTNLQKTLKILNSILKNSIYSSTYTTTHSIALKSYILTKFLAPLEKYRREDGEMEILRKIGSWLFLLGLLIAVIVGIVFGADQNLLAQQQTWIYTLLAVLGFVVGILSFFAVGQITKEKVPTFLIAALMLVGIGAALQTDFFGRVEYIGPYFTWIATMITAFVAPAAGLLAIRAIWDTGKSEDIEKVIPKLPSK